MKRLDQDAEDYHEQKQEIQHKLDYINVSSFKINHSQFYPKGTKYISILKFDPERKELNAKREEILEETKFKAKRNAEWKLKSINKEAGRKTKDIEADGFFQVADEDESSDSDANVVRREVDKKGNVI